MYIFRFASLRFASLRFASLALAFALFGPLSVQAYDWGQLAAISSTMGVNDGRLCLGEGTRGDIGCPTYAPFVSATSGFVGIGTSNPLGPLQVQSGAGVASGIILNNPINYWSLNTGSTSNYFSVVDSQFSRERLRIDQAGNIGMGTSMPSTTLHIAGTLRLADGGEACDANRVGAIRYTAAEFSFCRNGSAWETLSSIAGGGGPTDRITSGTTSAIANSAASRIDISGSLNLPAQNVASVTNNAILHNGARFIHTYRPIGNDGSNLFVGINSGNTTMTGGSAFFASFNTAIGHNTLYLNTTGSYNTASGDGALYSNTTGVYNTASGAQALHLNTTGANNTASGMQALHLNTTGANNTASGMQALYYNTTGANNTASGMQALLNTTTGGGNTALGNFTLSEVTTANNNTALGYNTGRGITTGSNNTILGANVGGLATDLSNTVIIADGSGNRRIYADGAGRVGIGTSTPMRLLTVRGDAGAANPNFSGGVGMLRLESSGLWSEPRIEFAEASFDPIAAISAKNTLGAAGDLILQTRPNAGVLTERMRVRGSDGWVGIGTTTPSSSLHVAGGETQVASSGAACVATNAGAMRYDEATKRFFVCRGTP